MKLSNKLILSFLFSIFVSISITSFISKTMIDNRFDLYLVEEQQSKLQFISDDLNALYNQNNYTLTESQIDSYATLEDVTIEIRDLNNNTLYNSSNNSGGMMGNGMGMHRRMMMHHNIPEGNYTDKSFPLFEGKNQVGYIIIGYIDNSYLTDSAIIFKETLTTSISISAIFTIIIGLGTSIFLSRSLTIPLLTIRNTAMEIQKGNLRNKSNVKTNTTEILELSNSINYLGDTLANQEDIRRKYAQDISHELRTPLSTLKSHLEAIIDGIWEADDEHLNILMEEIDRLSNLVTDLKNSFRAEDLNLVLNKTSFNISMELKSIVNSFIPLYDKEGFTLHTNIEDNININMDKDKLKQIIYNLLSNSIKYLSENGEVSIDLKEEKASILLTVEDNGTGIKEEDLPNLFDRFFRAGNLKDAKIIGTGLGLPIVKSIVDAHEGHIHVESVYGKGTKVVIELPA